MGEETSSVKLEHLIDTKGGNTPKAAAMGEETSSVKLEHLIDTKGGNTPKAAAMGEEAWSMKLKILIDTSTHRVLFAEAKKDFADFLFYLLNLPVGSIIRLLKDNSLGLVSSFCKVYESLETLDETYVISHQAKQSLLNNPTSYNNEMFYVAHTTSNNDGGGGGMVKRGFVMGGFFTYMVMDDLEVKPVLNTCPITLLKDLNVNDLDSLELKDVVFGMDEVLKLLKASMECKDVLTTVFLAEPK